MDTSELQTPSPIHSEALSESPPSSTALAACPQLDRSFSGSSITSSSRSASGQHSEANRRGYIRPQATVFADSARNRDSVLSLGSIAHLQFYFARTGLLDGKGAQFARDNRTNSNESVKTPDLQFSDTSSSLQFTEFSSYAHSQYDDSAYLDDASVLGSTDHVQIAGTWDDVSAINLPPTVSTYKQKQTYVPPPPDLSVLRRELRETLEDARKVLQELRADKQDDENEKDVNNSPTAQRSVSTNVGWHQVQGLHVLDLVTLAIRAARNYYTSHEQPQRLYSIKSEREIRGDLYAVLEALKKVATRNFAGGFHDTEIDMILAWVSSIEDLAARDEQSELNEQARRESWSWLDGDWAGQEKEREWLFLKSFDQDPDSLPEWTQAVTADGTPSAFLQAFQSGLRLVRLHNELVRNSRRQFGEIKAFHTDTAKPYRCSENLRFWVKAAELRWDVLLRIDVNGVVRGDWSAWQGLDEAILTWASAVRKEITEEWREYRKALHSDPPPVVRMETMNNIRAVSW